MKNPIKSYFLFFSSHPILYNIGIVALTIIGALIASGFMGMDRLNQLIPGRLIAIFMGAVALHIILIYSVAGVWITRPVGQGFDLFGDDDNLFSVLVTSEGQRIVLYRSIWKKGTRYSVGKPGDFSRFFVVHTDITGKHGNSSVNIPVSLQFNTDKGSLLGYGVNPEMELEIFESLLQDQDKENLNVEHYVRNVFGKLNESQKEAIDQVVAEYVQMEISTPEFLNRIINLVVFPERLFSWITSVKVCLGEPTFSSCKGMSCDNKA